MKNAIIRSEAKKKGVFLWEVADHLGIRDNQLSVKLRHQLSDDETKMLLSIINAIGEAKTNDES